MIKKLILISMALTCSLSYSKVRQTVWNPDTCDCEIVYNVDDKDPNTIVFDHFNKKCEAYKDLDDKTAFDTIVKENQVKNQTYQYIFDSFPSAIDTVITPEGKQAQILKDFTFTYDKDRNLTVSVKGLSAAQILNLNSKINSLQAINSLGKIAEVK